MTITVHPGSPQNAPYNSYLSVADADAYHTDRATADWLAATPTQKAAALIRATDFIDASYNFTIQKNDPNFGLPQSYFADAPVTYGMGYYYTIDGRFDGDNLHPLLKKATAVMAVYALTATLAEKRDERGILEEMKKLDGVGQTATKYTQSARDPYEVVTRILEPITASASTSGVVIGKLSR